MSLETYVIKDEQQRIKGFKFINGSNPGQYDTHTYSYLYSRGLYQEMGFKMGLDKEVYKK